MWNIPQIRKKSKSKRSRCRGRTLYTFNNKLSKLKSRYNYLFKTSQKSKEDFKKRDLKKVTPFFCDKYSTFDKFLVVNKMRQIGREEAPRKVFNKKEDRKKVTIWGR